MRATNDIIEKGLAYHRLGDLLAAEACYCEILDREPANPDALHLLGMIFFQKKHYGPATELIAKAISFDPNAAEFHAALGQALFADGKIDAAIASYRHAIAMKNDLPDVHYNLGSALLVAREFVQSIASLQQAVARRPDFADAFNNLGSALRGLGKLDEAAACYQRAMTLRPTDARACVNLGQVLKTIGQIDSAIACFDRALALAPDLADARSGKIYTLHFHPACNSAHLLWENLQWNQWHAKPLRPVRQTHANDPSPDRKLRIGYVSPDFRDHVAGLYLLPLLREHDREQFDLYCYTNASRRDAITDRFQSYCVGWREIARMDDAAAEQMIREDRIDILIDTTMHMGGSRLPLFARKPAPMQVTMCAYPSTAGVETIDYRFTDPYLDPPEAGDAMYAERSIRLPHTFWCYDPLDDLAPYSDMPGEGWGEGIVIDHAKDPHPSPLAAYRKGEPESSWAITFGCLNNFCKVNDAVLLLWARVMRVVPKSRLVLLAPVGSARRGVIGKFGREGIDADRIEFVDLRPRRAYLETYHRIDIALDTFPYNGHTTSLDAFWMGVPVITLIGQTAVGRAGWSQLSNLGLTELAARDSDQYVAIAAALATDRPRLATLRAGLRQRVRQSPLMDARGFTAGVEAAYRQLWRQWCRSNPVDPPGAKYATPNFNPHA